jgi:hypothetical protein
VGWLWRPFDDVDQEYLPLGDHWARGEEGRAEAPPPAPSA